MKIIMIILVLAALILPTACTVTPVPKGGSYAWFSIELVPRDSTGKVKGKPNWQALHHIKPPVDVFLVYGNNDSIKMVTADVPAGNMFRKIDIGHYKWKPKPDYGNELFFLGTYASRDLPGFYFSYYASKDWKSLMQVEYSNPGNLILALLFSKDSSNILQAHNIIIDPADEKAEPERPQVHS